MVPKEPACAGFSATVYTKRIVAYYLSLYIPLPHDKLCCDRKCNTNSLWTLSLSVSFSLPPSPSPSLSLSVSPSLSLPLSPLPPLPVSVRHSLEAVRHRPRLAADLYSCLQHRRRRRA